MQIEFVGQGSTQRLTDYLYRLKVKKLLLVTGKASYHECGAKKVFDEILAGYEWLQFDDFSVNPKFDEAMVGVELCRKEKIDLIIAIGGGSVIDMAKCVAAFHSSAGSEIELARGDCNLDADPLPVIAVPTTAGTGSESTHFAVIYVDEKKYSLAAQSLLPIAAVLDPVYTHNLPAEITASTGFDALCQAVESFWAVASTAESRTYAAEAISLLLRYLPIAVNAPDQLAREKMLYAAHLAGKAINISKTTAPHALSYPITSLYGIPHGHAAAMTLGSFFPFHESSRNLELNGNLTRDQFESRMQELFDLLGVTTYSAAKVFWYELMQRCGLKLSLGSQPVALSSKLEEIAAAVNIERLSNHPIKFTATQLLEILRSVPAN